MTVSRLKANRERLDVDLRDSPRRKLVSPALYALYAALPERLAAHARGRLLDAGCGTMPFRSILDGLIDEYHSYDVARRVPDVDFVGDVQDMQAVAAGSYDTVLCTEVLEHVPYPARVVAECQRVLRSSGKLVLSVPFLSRLHEEPHDYFRYTVHGLRSLIEDAGLRVVEITPTGSVFSFLGHQVSSVFVCSAWHVPVLRDLVFWLNAGLVTLPAYWLDRLSGLGRSLPLGYVVVAQKP